MRTSRSLDNKFCLFAFSSLILKHIEQHIQELDDISDWLEVLATPMATSTAVKKLSLDAAKQDVKSSAKAPPQKKPKAAPRKSVPATPRKPVPAQEIPAVQLPHDLSKYLWLHDFQTVLDYVVHGRAQAWDAVKDEVLPYALRVCLILALGEAVTLNGTKYSKWSQLRKYIQTFVTAAVDAADTTTGGDGSQDPVDKTTLPLSVVGLKKVINSIVPEPDDEPDDEPLDCGSTESMPFTKESMMTDVDALNTPENLAHLAKLESYMARGKHVRFQPEVVSMASQFIADCQTVTTFNSLAQLMFKAVSVVAGNHHVWHLLHLIQFEVIATKTTTITGSLICADGVSSKAVVCNMLKLRADYATYLVKTLCDCDDDEWPFTQRAGGSTDGVKHIARPTLERSLFVCSSDLGWCQVVTWRGLVGSAKL